MLLVILNLVNFNFLQSEKVESIKNIIPFHKAHVGVQP